MKIKSLDSTARNLWLEKETGLKWFPEHPICDNRNWRADHACMGLQTIIEVDGGIWVRGRHTRGAGVEADNEKLNTAAVLGWYVLRYSTQQFARGDWVEDVRALIVRVRGDLLAREKR